jgi:hypothetical protein
MSTATQATQKREKLSINGQTYVFQNNVFYFRANQYVLARMKPEEIEALAHALLEEEGQTILIESDEEASTTATDTATTTTTEKTT